MQRIPAALVAILCLCFFAATSIAFASIFAPLEGVIHDPQHRPVQGAQVTLHAAHSALSFSQTTGPDGIFRFNSVPAGVYIVTVTATNFASQKEVLTITANSRPILHFALSIARVTQTTRVSA